MISPLCFFTAIQLILRYYKVSITQKKYKKAMPQTVPAASNNYV